MKKRETGEKGITSRSQNYSQWYLDVIEAAALAEHAPVRGFMVIKPYGYALWERIQGMLDERFKETGVENAYFPLLIPEKFLKKEAEHVEGFAPEVAVVTHAGGKKLKEPLVVRPTSETVMYATFSKWVQSHRDLPLLINQWANVVRWELRPRLFLRTTEFLWQEGHTVHETEAEADARARTMLEVYRVFLEEVLAIPVFVGTKSESEKFAGALTTYTTEAMMQDGKALQCATSHNLGQNFSKVFRISFLNKDNVRQYAWQTSWGLSTRVIGALVMAHGDDKGLVLPPRIAPIQAVVIPIWYGDEERRAVGARASEIVDALSRAGIATKIDSRDLRPGEKYFEWEKKGVPVRVEVGPKDMTQDTAVIVRRDTGEKQTVKRGELARDTQKLLDEMQKGLYARALTFRKAHTKSVDTWKEFVREIEGGNFVLAHWSGDAGVEAKIKSETQATIRCIPFDAKKEKGKCVYCGKPSPQRVLFARAY